MKKILICIILIYFSIKIVDTKCIKATTDLEEEKETPDSVIFQY